MGAMGQMLTAQIEPECMTVLEKRSRGNPTIAVTRANTAREISSAVSLLVPEYHRMGYLPSDDDQTKHEQFVSLQKYSVYIAWKENRPLTTIGFTTGDPLPIDSVFGPELDKLRSEGFRIGELGKLAGRGSVSILLRLMAEVFVSEAQVAVDVIAITVNPCHAHIYAHHFGFSYLDTIPRFYPHLSNTPPALGMFAHLEQIMAKRGPARVLSGMQHKRFAA